MVMMAHIKNIFWPSFCVAISAYLVFNIFLIECLMWCVGRYNILRLLVEDSIKLLVEDSISSTKRPKVPTEGTDTIEAEETVCWIQIQKKHIWFATCIVNDRNSLSPSIVNAPSLNAFKSNLDASWADIVFATPDQNWQPGFLIMSGENEAHRPSGLINLEQL